jgi:hypothetical protein
MLEELGQQWRDWRWSCQLPFATTSHQLGGLRCHLQRAFGDPFHAGMSAFIEVLQT